MTERGPKARSITQDMLMASTSMARSRSETPDQYLERVTHFHLQAKRIKKIEGLEKCTNMKVLYLYDNLIESIEGLDFAKLLSYLYLQNNLIAVIPKLNMGNLRKLFLDDNDIYVVSGLEGCTKLEELHVARQRLPKYQPLEFEDESLKAISQSLQVLEISGNAISNLTQFSDLQYLRKMFCNDNDIQDVSELQIIVSLPELVEASFLRNPCCQTSRYRDYVIAASSETLRILDEIPVPKHQQVAIKGLQNHRRKLGYDSHSSSTAYDPDLDFTVLPSHSKMRIKSSTSIPTVAPLAASISASDDPASKAGNSLSADSSVVTVPRLKSGVKA